MTTPHFSSEALETESSEYGSTKKKKQVSPEQCLKPRTAFSRRQWGSLAAATFGNLAWLCVPVTHLHKRTPACAQL